MADKYRFGKACTRCQSLFCSCAYEPIQRMSPPLLDSDVERIAQRVVELMRAERGGAE